MILTIIILDKRKGDASASRIQKMSTKDVFVNRIKADDDQTKTALNINNQREKVEKRGVGCGTKLTHNEFVLMVAVQRPLIELVGKYIDQKTTIDCKCRVCGSVWRSLPDTILNGSGCISCLKRTRTHENLVSDVAQLSPSVELIGRYIDANTKIQCRCRDCGNEW